MVSTGQMGIWRKARLRRPPRPNAENGPFASWLQEDAAFGLRSSLKAAVWQHRGREELLSSHIWVVRTPASFGRHPNDVLIRVLDIASFAVDAVLRIDDVAQRAA